MYSLAKGKISIPELWNAKKARIQGAQLCAQKATLERLYQHLKAKIG
jgi:hypothetical protein